MGSKEDSKVKTRLSFQVVNHYETWQEAYAGLDYSHSTVTNYFFQSLVQTI